MTGYPALYFPEIRRFEPLTLLDDGAYVVGRSASADIVIPDPTCSREQFVVLVSGGKYKAKPTSQGAITLHNGKPLSQAVELSHNDRITFGFTTIVYLERDSEDWLPAQGTIVGDDPRKTFKTQRPPDELAIDRDRILGRAPGVDGIILDHPRVSRTHAEIRFVDGKPFLRDLASSNGTFLNGERVSAAEELKALDRIDIDPFSFRFTGRSLVPFSREGQLRVIARDITTIIHDRATGHWKTILADMNLVVEPGEFVCILGASGSGKSTAMKALSARACGDRDTELKGAVYLNELDLYANFQALKHSIALVPQRDVLYENLRLRECLRYSARLRLPADSSRAEIENAVDQALERVGLKDFGTTPIRKLSGGQKKRAALANETVSRPDLLFLDEVTSGLDEGTDWEMMELFRDLARRHGITVICVTHTVANVELCDKVVVLTPSENDKQRGPGLLAYYGPPAGAKLWFGIDKLGDVYRKLSAAEGEFWQRKYRASSEFERFIGRPLRVSQDLALDSRPDVKRSDPFKRPHISLREFIRQLHILTTRYVRLLSADHVTLKFAAAQSVVIGVSLVAVFWGMAPREQKEPLLLFFLGISCFWCGCNNASKEIVKEQALYRIERDVNLSLPAYIVSKIVTLAAFGVLQVCLLFAIVSGFGTLPGDKLSNFFRMCVSLLVGSATGIFLSSVSDSEDQASTLVPIALIPQILLSGLVVPNLPALPHFVAQKVVSGFWVNSLMNPRNHSAVVEALAALAVHIGLLWSASCLALFRRDVRRQPS